MKRHVPVLVSAVLAAVLVIVFNAWFSAPSPALAQGGPPMNFGEQQQLTAAPNYWVFNSELNVKRKGTSADDVTRNTIMLNTQTGTTWILRPSATQTSYAWFELNRN